MNEKKKISVDDLGDVFVLSIFYDDLNGYECLWMTDTKDEAYENACKDFIDRIGKEEVQKYHKEFYSSFSRENWREAFLSLKKYPLSFSYQIDEFLDNRSK